MTMIMNIKYFFLFITVIQINQKKTTIVPIMIIMFASASAIQRKEIPNERDSYIFIFIFFRGGGIFN